LLLAACYLGSTNDDDEVAPPPRPRPSALCPCWNTRGLRFDSEVRLCGSQVDPARRQRVQAEPGPEFEQRMACGGMAGMAADEFVTSQEQLAEGWRAVPEFTTDDMLQVLRVPSASSVVARA